MAGQSTTRSRSTLLAAGAFLTVATAAVFLYRLHGKKSKNSATERQNHQDPNVAPELLKLFQAAAQESKQLTQISNTEKLILYSLYKQSMEGDAPKQSPGFTAGIVEKAKYSAWNRVRGMTATQAMVHYIEAVQQLRQHGSVDTTGVAAEGLDAEELDFMDELSSGFASKPSSLANNPEDEDDYAGKDLTAAQKLLRAAGRNDVGEIKSILAEDPDLIDHRDEDGQSALHLAADKGAADALKVLMEFGADGNAADGDGITVLQAAVIAENIEACRVLLNYGADPDKTDVDGDTPRKCAEEDGTDEMKKLFASYK